MMTERYLHECFMVTPKTGRLYWRIRPVSHFGSEEECKGWNQEHAGFPVGWPDVHNPLKQNDKVDCAYVTKLIKQLQADA